MADPFIFTIPRHQKPRHLAPDPVKALPTKPVTAPDVPFLSPFALSSVAVGGVLLLVGHTLWRYYKASSTTSRQPSASPVNPVPQLPPELPAGRYEKLREIGRGAFGVVYVGRHTRTGELVAIKEMSAEVGNELRAEFQLVNGLTHPNVVQVKGFEQGRRHARLYLEWVAGGSLKDIIRCRKIQDEKLLASYVRQIVEGLHFLHTHGILHRDIKPHNILVSHTGQLVLTDFGLSRHLETINDQTRCTGTPVYLAPECIDGRYSVGSDIWALGATVTEMLTGELPWSHIDPSIFRNQMTFLFYIHKYMGDRKHHPVFPDSVSDTLKLFLLKCFHPDPRERGTCLELLNHPFLQVETPLGNSFAHSSSVSSVANSADKSPGGSISPAEDEPDTIKTASSFKEP